MIRSLIASRWIAHGLALFALPHDLIRNISDFLGSRSRAFSAPLAVGNSWATACCSCMLFPNISGDFKWRTARQMIFGQLGDTSADRHTPDRLAAHEALPC